MMLTEGFFTLYDNLRGDFCSHDIEEGQFTTPHNVSSLDCVNLLSTRSSVFNKMNQTISVYIGEGLNVGTVFVVVLLFQIFRKV